VFRVYSFIVLIVPLYVFTGGCQCSNWTLLSCSLLHVHVSVLLNFNEQIKWWIQNWNMVNIYKFHHCPSLPTFQKLFAATRIRTWWRYHCAAQPIVFQRNAKNNYMWWIVVYHFNRILQTNVFATFDKLFDQPLLELWWKIFGLLFWGTVYVGCQEFFNCRCIEGGRASLGACPRNCQTMFYVYVALQFITFVLSSVTVVPLMTSLVRSALHRSFCQNILLIAWCLGSWYRGALWRFS